MKPALQAKLGTGLALTPQLHQAIRLLRLSQLELETELQAAVDSNPLLELAEPGDTGTLEDSANTDDFDASHDDAAAATEILSDEEWSVDDYESVHHASDSERDEAGAEPGLHEHLRWQLRMSVHSPRDEAIGEAIIDALDEDGYLCEPLETLPATLPVGLGADHDAFRSMLRLVQQFDPLGCGARHLSECLRLQLDALSTETPGLGLAQRLVARHLDAVARARPEKLATDLGIDAAALAEAIALVKSLDPKPGARFSGTPAEYVQPDAIAVKQHGIWRARMVRGGSKLRLNAHYQRLLGHCSREDDAYLRGQLRDARWLIKAVENRGETLQRVAEAIVRAQCAFLDHGLEAMRPLTLREVAEQLGLHESTISRATTRKFLRTPRGTFEFKFFFRSGVSTDYGSAASSTAVQAMIRKLIEAEPTGKRLSDQALADLLKVDGIAVARRTVAKYREGMGIPPSPERGGR